jgi:F0F1-type ATP synthase membrane subunit a
MPVDSVMVQTAWGFPDLVVVDIQAVVFAVLAVVAGAKEMKSMSRGHDRNMNKNLPCQR